MKRLFENMSAAAAMAEGGLWDEALDIAGLENLRGNRRKKVLLVNGSQTLPEDVLGYALDLSRRLESDLLILMPQPRMDAGDLRQEVKSAVEKAGAPGQANVFCLTARGELVQAARSVLRLAKRVELALLHGIEDRSPYRRLRIPLYSTSP